MRAKTLPVIVKIMNVDSGKLSHCAYFSYFIAYSSRKLSVKEVIRPPVDDDEDGMGSMLKEFQQKRAAKTLQREWRGYQGRKQRVMEEKEREEENRQNEAAATLQKNWRRHRERVGRNGSCLQV